MCYIDSATISSREFIEGNSITANNVFLRFLVCDKEIVLLHSSGNLECMFDHSFLHCSNYLKAISVFMMLVNDKLFIYYVSCWNFETPEHCDVATECTMLLFPIPRNTF